jgi:PKD repeat protein
LPNVEQGVNFVYNAPRSPLGPLRWDYGDGVVYIGIKGVTTSQHAYRAAGTYTVQAQAQIAGVPAPLITARITIVERRSVTYAPPNPMLGQPVTFSAHNFLSPTLQWDFDDGPPYVAGLREVHVFREAGTHGVVVKDMEGKSAVSFVVSLVIGGPPSIIFAPGEPRVNEPIEFRAVNFASTSLVRWDFGDGVVENDTSPPVVTHAFRNPGTYSVRAYDGGSGTPTAQAVVRVLPERFITFNPPDPRVGEEITFRAFNFNSQTLRWDFGDGTVLDPAGTQVTHAFGTAGPWTVRAFDRSGGAEVVKALSFTVLPSQGPRSRFAVSYIQLRFEDGKSYKVIPREYGDLTAFAEIKFESTGVLQAQWLVDGMPFKTVFATLSFAGNTIIDSGRVPGLPSLIPGLHEVTLNVMQPRAEFGIPVIRYFVTAGAEPPEAVDVLLAGAGTIDGAVLGGDEQTIEAPAGTHFLLKGKVRHESGAAIAVALLRLFLDDEIIDQKLIRDLEPGEERGFESSVFNPTADRKRLVIALYNISHRPASILFLKDLSVVPPK